MELPAYTLTTCPSSLSLTRPFNNVTAQGIIGLEVTNNANAYLSKVDFQVDGQTVAVSNEGAGAYWRVDFNTATIPNGLHSFSSLVQTGPDSICRTNTAQVKIENPVASTKELRTIPNQTNWRGPTNFSYSFFVNTYLLVDGNPQNVTSQASYVWETSIGSVKINGNSAAYSSGPNPGSGQIVVTATYGSLQSKSVIYVNVDSADTQNTYPEPSTMTTNPYTSTLTPGITASPSGSASVTVQPDDRQLENCLIHVFGKEKYVRLTTQHQRLTYDDIPKAEQCFARSKYLIPSNLAPTAPSAVKKLKEDSKKATVEKMERLITGNPESLVISGSSEPNKTLLIYIFSEPLVLTTKSDKNGRWTYTLQDPLEGGKHEAYVTVKGDDGQPVRSSGFGFAIATAPKTLQNPRGLSLNLENNNSNFYYAMYIVSATLCVMVSVGVVLYLIHHKRKSQDSDPKLLPPSLPNVQG